MLSASQLSLAIFSIKTTCILFGQKSEFLVSILGLVSYAVNTVFAKVIERVRGNATPLDEHF